MIHSLEDVYPLTEKASDVEVYAVSMLVMRSC